MSVSLLKGRLKGLRDTLNRTRVTRLAGPHATPEKLKALDSLDDAIVYLGVIEDMELALSNLKEGGAV